MVNIFVVVEDIQFHGWWEYTLFGSEFGLISHLLGVSTQIIDRCNTYSHKYCKGMKHLWL